MTRFARAGRVFFFEEPLFGVANAELRISRDRGVFVCVPHLPAGLSDFDTTNEVRRLLDELVSTHRIERPVVWYYTPMALSFARHLSARAVVFDCMDELSAFRGAPPGLLDNEQELLSRADLVFTGGQSLYEAKRDRHRRVFAFPSSVDVAHFAAARLNTVEPTDQASIPHPRLGFFGVVDERMDLELMGAVAAARPDWHLVVLGPCVKIDPATLPQRENIHYLGMKSYAELPGYLSGWDVALLPFARNESTRFISPTKTPEYLAAGCPVVSTGVRDVVRPYGERGFVSIADTPDGFIAAIEGVLAGQSPEWRAEVDRFIGQMSWDRTWDEMSRLIDGISGVRTVPAAGPATRPDITQRIPASDVQPNV